MANSILKLQHKYQSSTTKNIAYIVNSGVVITDYSGWTGFDSTEYEFVPTGTASVGNSITLKVYKNNSFIKNIVIPYTFSDPITWFGVANNAIDGIDIDLALELNSSSHVAENFTLSTTINYTTATIGENDMQVGASKAYKVILRDGAGDHTVYHQALNPSTVSYISKTTTSIYWRYYNPSSNPINVDIWAKLNRSPYTSYIKIGSSIVPGSYINKTWTGLASGTSHITTVYLVPVIFALLNSNTYAPSAITTTAAANKIWVYSLTDSAVPTNDLFVEGTAESWQDAEFELNDIYSPNSYDIGDKAVYDPQSTSDYWVYILEND